MGSNIRVEEQAKVRLLERENQTLRDERDRLARRVKDLEGRFKLVGKYLANGRTQQAHDLVKDTVLAVDMTQAALTPAAKGGNGE